MNGYKRCFVFAALISLFLVFNSTDIYSQVQNTLCNKSYIGSQITISPNNPSDFRDLVYLVNSTFNAHIMIGTGVKEIPLGLSITAPWTSIVRAIMSDNSLGVECYDNGNVSLINPLSLINQNSDSLLQKQQIDIQAANLKRLNAPITREAIKLRYISLPHRYQNNLLDEQSKGNENLFLTLEQSILKIVQADGDNRGEVVRIPERNELLIAGTQQQIDQIRTLIESVDVAPKQVFIRAVFYTIDEKYINKFAPKFSAVMGNSQQANFLQEMSSTSIDPNDKSKVMGIMTIDTVSFLRLFEEARLSKAINIISSPFGLIPDLQTFSFEMGNEIPLSNAEGFITVARSIRITPQIVEKNKDVLTESLFLTLQIENNTIDPFKDTFNGLPAINRESIQTVLQVKTGQLIVIGGLVNPVEKGRRIALPLFGTIFNKRKKEMLYCAIIAQTTPTIK
jgi:type II secretory pathway component HofQ